MGRFLLFIFLCQHTVGINYRKRGELFKLKDNTDARRRSKASSVILDCHPFRAQHQRAGRMKLTHVKEELDKKILNVVVCGVIQLNLRIQDTSSNSFFPGLLKQEIEMGNSKRSNRRNDGGRTTSEEVLHLEVKAVNGLPL